MAYTLCFWHSAVGDPDETFDRLSDDDRDAVVAHPDVAEFRAEALRRWPSFEAYAEPEDPAGAAAYLMLHLPWETDEADVEALLDLARNRDLVVHDPQEEEL